MLLGELNLFITLFIILSIALVINVTSALHLILTAELLWITLYIITLFVSFTYDNLNILSLTFFFLMLSAAEFGIGLVLVLNQHLLFRSISLDVNTQTRQKFNNYFNKKIKTNTFKFL